MGKNVDRRHAKASNPMLSLEKELKFMSQFRPADIVSVVDPWCEENLKGEFAVFDGIQYFQFKEDKAAFTLRWA